MNKLLIKFIILFSLINNSVYSQDNIKTAFYNFDRLQFKSTGVLLLNCHAERM